MLSSCRIIQSSVRMLQWGFCSGTEAARCTWLLLLLFSRSVVSDSLGLHGVQPTRLLCPWDFPGKKSGAGCRCLLQGIFLTQGSNLRLVHWQGDSSALGHQRSLSTWLGNGNTEDNNDNGVTISSRDGKHLHSGYWLPGSALSIWYKLSLLSS